MSGKKQSPTTLTFARIRQDGNVAKPRAYSTVDGLFAGCHRGLRRSKDAAHRCTEFGDRRGVARSGDSFSVDLTRIDEGRNVNPFVSGD